MPGVSGISRLRGNTVAWAVLEIIVVTMEYASKMSNSIDPINSYHVVLDLETLSLRSNAAIIGYGVVIISSQLEIVAGYEDILFDPFSEPFHMQSRYNMYDIDNNTVEFWRSNELAEARAYMQDNGHSFSIKELCVSLSDTLAAHIHSSQNYLVYGYGSNFDVPIIEHAFSVERVGVPWGHKQPTCARTLARFLSDKDVSEVKSEGTQHTPLADAMHEAKLLISVLRKLSTVVT